MCYFKLILLILTLLYKYVKIHNFSHVWFILYFHSKIKHQKSFSLVFFVVLILFRGKLQHSAKNPFLGFFVLLLPLPQNCIIYRWSSLGAQSKQKDCYCHAFEIQTQLYFLSQRYPLFSISFVIHHTKSLDFLDLKFSYISVALPFGSRRGS